MGRLVNKTIVDKVKPLYDIEVEDNHNFVVNDGVVVHNSEQYLSRDSLCVLSSINAERFSTEPDEYEKEFSVISESINRFLDNTIQKELDDNLYATYHQKMANELLRRTGAGVTNLCGWLLKRGLEYGTEAANKEIGHFIERYNYYLYKSTIELGKEKGSFGMFDPEKIRNSEFIQHMERLGLEFTHMRNVTVSSIAPTGTLTLGFSRMALSYGIEPAFSMYYWKRTRISGQYEYYFIVPGVVRDLFEKAGYPIPMKSDTIKDDWAGTKGKEIAEYIDTYKDEIGIVFKKDTEVSAFDKLNLMGEVMKNIDSSISVTYNLPENTKPEDVYNFILTAHKKGVKSIAAFPDMKIYGIVSTEPFKDLAFRLKSENISIHPQNFTEEEQAELNISEDNIMISEAPKRPRELEADIHVVTVDKEKYIVAIGLMNGAPYEVFGGKMTNISLRSRHKAGKLVKVKKGTYSLIIDEFEFEDFSKQFTPVEMATFRLISTNLRHGVPIKFIVEQLKKSADDMLSFVSAISRVLKKYIKNGEAATGIKCPSCGGTNLHYTDGCVTCADCDWSKCD